MTCKNCHRRKQLSKYNLCAECTKLTKDKAREIINDPSGGFKV